MTVTLMEGVAAVLMYLLGGALVLFIYEAYVKTRQRNMIFLALGFFILIFGGNLGTLNAAAQAITAAPPLDDSTVRTASLVIQLVGILLLLYSIVGPFEPRHPKE
ncbi:MAG TPA: hypothetical protein VK436_06705 [Methanocella sp.]|nr:hypothetical protein [Methanocella sp.]